MAKYPDIFAGMRMTADILDSMLPDTVRKGTTETVTSSTTLQNDDELFVSVEANATYQVDLSLIHSSGTSGDIKITFDGPSGASMTWGAIGAHINETSSTTVTAVNMQGRAITETTEFGGGNLAAMTAYVSGTLVTSGTAGTLNFQWAQRVSDPAATQVRAGSSLIVRRIA